MPALLKYENTLICSEFLKNPSPWLASLATLVLLLSLVSCGPFHYPALKRLSLSSAGGLKGPTQHLGPGGVLVDYSTLL